MRVLVVDDDLVYRLVVTRTLGRIDGVEVIGAVSSLQAARARIDAGGVDAISLDVVLRNENGPDLLPWLRANHPKVAAFLVTSGTMTTARNQVDAILLGAAGLIRKPSGANSEQELERSLRATFGDLVEAQRYRHGLATGAPEMSASHIVAARREVVAVGASTGGPPVVRQLLTALPADFAPPVVVVQHLPAGHAAFYVDLLAQSCGRQVVPARTGLDLAPRTVYVASEERHLTVVRRGGALGLAHVDTAPEHGCRPAVDPLFRSVATHVGAAAIGVVMTGMGSDGALGALSMKKAGAAIVVQDKASSVVWGMPGAAVAVRAADVVVPGPELASWVVRWTQRDPRSNP